MLHLAIRNSISCMIIILILTLLTVNSVNGKRKKPKNFRHGTRLRRHQPISGTKSGIVFSDEVSFPFEAIKDLNQTNSLQSAEKGRVDDAALLENTFSVVKSNASEHIIDQNETQVLPNVKSLMATLKEDEGNSKDQVKTIYKKLANDFESLQDLLAKKDPKLYGNSSSKDGKCFKVEGCKEKDFSNVLTIQDVDSLKGPLTRITLLRRHIIERRNDLDLPHVPHQMVDKYVKLRVQPA